MQAVRAPNSGSAPNAGAELASLVHKHISRGRKRGEKERKNIRYCVCGGVLFCFVLFFLS